MPTGYGSRPRAYGFAPAARAYKAPAGGTAGAKRDIGAGAQLRLVDLVEEPDALGGDVGLDAGDRLVEAIDALQPDHAGGGGRGGGLLGHCRRGGEAGEGKGAGGGQAVGDAA